MRWIRTTLVSSPVWMMATIVLAQTPKTLNVEFVGELQLNRPAGQLEVPPTSDIYVSGDYAYIGTFAIDAHELYIVDVSDPAQMALVATVPITGTAHDVKVDGDIAVVAGHPADAGLGGITVIDAPTLSADSRTGFENIARHLYTLGHRRLAYIEGPEGSANHNRLRGLEDFVRSVEGVSLQRVPGGATSTSGMDAVDALVKTRATAAIAFNDLVGLGVVHGLGERGLRVPDDISVTGFDDIPFARFMTPTLTTASVPHEILGGLAWSRLHALIEGRTPEHNVVFQPRLEARRSTAAPPSA